MDGWKTQEVFINLGNKFQRLKDDVNKSLIDASKQGNKELIKEAIISGAHINSIIDNESALFAALDDERLEIAEYLLRLGANPTLLLPTGSDVIWHALWQQKHDFLDLFSRKVGRWNRDAQHTGKTLLMEATEISDVTAVRILAQRCNVHEKDQLGNTALHYNMKKVKPSEDDVEIGRILLAAGSDKFSRNADNVTPDELANNPEMRAVIREKELSDNIIGGETYENDMENKPNQPENKMPPPKLRPPKPFKI